MDRTEYIKKWSEKLQISVEEIEQEFQNILKENPDETQALRKLAMQYKRQLRSPAIPFEGIIIGASDCVDIIAKQRREAQEMFKTDPQLAVTQGVTDEEGNPLDTKEEWSTGKKNPQFGKPLPEHNYLRNLWVVAKPSKSADLPQMFNMVLSGEKAQNAKIPMFKPVKFMAIQREDRLNPSSFTKFDVDESINMPNVVSIIKSYLVPLKISQLAEYHSKGKDDFNRICAVEGDVSVLNTEPTAFGSKVMVLEDLDASLEDLDTPSLTCWVPEHVELDFAEGSKVIVIGRTNQGKLKDEAGNVTEDLADVTMGAFGIYAIPEFKTELPTENLED